LDCIISFSAIICSLGYKVLINETYVNRTAKSVLEVVIWILCQTSHICWRVYFIEQSHITYV